MGERPLAGHMYGLGTAFCGLGNGLKQGTGDCLQQVVGTGNCLSPGFKNFAVFFLFLQMQLLTEENLKEKGMTAGAAKKLRLKLDELG